MMDVIRISDAAQRLGEGPMWHSGEEALFWVDIDRCALWRWSEHSGEQSWPLPVQASGVLRAFNHEIWLATDVGVCAFDIHDLTFRSIYPIEEHATERRSNEARCDPQGVIWFSTLDRAERGTSGRIYRIDQQGTVELWRAGIGIPNTLVWSPKGERFYFGDSKARTIFTATYNSDNSKPGEVERWMSLGDRWPSAVPDGSAMDIQGCLWTALWDGSRIVRHNASGKLDREVLMPVQRPTSCTFGGHDLDILFITTANIGLDSVQLAEQKTAGCLYAFRPGDGIQGINETVDGYPNVV